MTKVIIHFEENEHNALHQLAEREYRTITAQVALMIHQQLQNLKLIPCDDDKEDQQMSPLPTKVS